MSVVRWIVVAVVFVALLFLSLQNSQTARLTLFNVAAWEAPLVVIVFIAFACGVAAGSLESSNSSSPLAVGSRMECAVFSPVMRRIYHISSPDQLGKETKR